MSEHLRALGGTVAVIAGVLLVVFELGFLGVDVTGGGETMAETVQQPSSITFALLGVLAIAMAVPAVLVIYRQQAEESGTFGLVALGVTCLGLTLLGGALWATAFMEPYVAEQAPQLITEDGPLGWLEVGYMSTFIIAALGFLLFGIATLRAGVFPRWAGALMIVAGIIGFTPVPFGPGVLLGAALIGCGAVLRRLNNAPASARSGAPDATAPAV